MRNLLGGKGANLAEMTNLGLPIPQGFTVTTEACTEYYNCGEKISSEIEEQIFSALRELEEIQGKKFGDEYYLYNGVHPTLAGSRLIADEWFKVCKKYNLL